MSEMGTANLAISSRLMTCYRSFLFRVVAVVVAALLLFIITRRKQQLPKFQLRPIDVSSLILTTEEVAKLTKETNLRPVTSRGALIFVDGDGVIRIPSDDIIERMEFRDLEELYDRYLTNIQVACKRQIHMGHVYDGGYDICEEDKYAPSAGCLVYSVGTHNDFSFDDSVRQIFGCEVHCFDPSTTMKEHEHSPGIHFHPIGLGDRDEVNDEKWVMRTLKSIKEQLGHSQRNIDILKIDIEAGEWKALPDIISSGQLKGVKQLIMEFHSSLYGLTHIHRSHSGYRHYLKIFREIYNEGFRIFFYRRWIADCCLFVDEFGINRTGCLEVHFLKVF